MSKFYFFIAFALTGIITSAQTVNIPDPNFKAKLITGGVDADNDGAIQLSEALNVTDLYLDSANISSLEGIQSFANLRNLWCSFNPLTEVNLCGTAVAYLSCSDCPNLRIINLKNDVISETIWQEPPFPPFFVWNLPSLQYVCVDAAEMTEAQLYFPYTTANTITFTSDCSSTNCSSLLSIPEIVSGFNFTVYPNPVKNFVTISFKEKTAIQSISIYNVLGQVEQLVTNPTETIDVSGLKTGNYFIKIISDKGTATSKFVKE